VSTSEQIRAFTGHELIYGYVTAVVAGFLLTAVPNWTERLPVVGTPLLLLFLTWATGRIAVFASLWIGPRIVAAVDLAFLTALGFVVGRGIVAGNNILSWFSSCTWPMCLRAGRIPPARPRHSDAVARRPDWGIAWLDHRRHRPHDACRS